MPLMRRRPLLRAAVVGGSAYAAGKHRERQSAHEYEQDQQLAAMQSAPAPAPYAPPPPPSYSAPPPPPPAPSRGTSAADRVSALTDLKGLLDSGVLTQAEFEAQKQKILQEG